METIGKNLKRAKTWNIVLIVLSVLSVVSGVMGLPGTIKPDTSVYKDLGELGKTMTDYINSPLTKAYAIVSLILSIVLLVLFFLNNRKMNQKIIPTKIAYYVYIGWNVLSTIYGLLIKPKMEVEGIDMGMIVSGFGIFVTLLVCIPAIIVIYNLFKAEPEEVV